MFCLARSTSLWPEACGVPCGRKVNHIPFRVRFPGVPIIPTLHFVSTVLSIATTCFLSSRHVLASLSSLPAAASYRAADLCSFPHKGVCFIDRADHSFFWLWLPNTYYSRMFWLLDLNIAIPLQHHLCAHHRLLIETLARRGT